MACEHQLIAFALPSLASIVAFREFLKRRPIETDQPLLNQRTAQYVGPVDTLERAKVRVVAAEGVILEVKRLV